MLQAWGQEASSKTTATSVLPALLPSEAWPSPHWPGAVSQLSGRKEPWCVAFADCVVSTFPCADAQELLSGRPEPAAPDSAPPSPARLPTRVPMCPGCTSCPLLSSPLDWHSLGWPTSVPKADPEPGNDWSEAGGLCLDSGHRFGVALSQALQSLASDHEAPGLGLDKRANHAESRILGGGGKQQRALVPVALNFQV